MWWIVNGMKAAVGFRKVSDLVCLNGILEAEEIRRVETRDALREVTVWPALNRGER